MNDVARAVNKAIKLGKWLAISYQNAQSQITNFWCAVKDVDAKQKTLKVKMFNINKSSNVLTGDLYFEHILAADVIEGTYYESPASLLQKLEENPLEYAFLQYAPADDCILDYYSKCYYEDGLNYYKEYCVFDGIDLRVLEDNDYCLSEKYLTDMIARIKTKEKKKHKELYGFAISELAITINDKLYPIAYRNILLDIDKKKSHCSKTTRFNLRIDNENDKLKFDLNKYLEMDPHVFMQKYQENKEEYTTLLMENLDKNQKIDEMPYFFEIKQPLKMNIEQEYSQIKESYQNKTLSRPLRAFFGLKQQKYRMGRSGMILLDDSPNIEQLTTIYNSLNQDVLYVQGPPGTGKTATIVNVILSHFFHQKTILITSNNNEAIHSIEEKLSKPPFSFKFPLLRLGNDACIKKTLQELKTLVVPKRECLHSKSYFLDDFSAINQSISQYERQKELEEELDAMQSFIKQISKSHLEYYQKEYLLLSLKASAEKLQMESKQIEVSNLSPFDNQELLDYLAYISYSYLKKLATHTALQEILEIEDEELRVKAFKSYLKQDENIRELQKIFPIILSTNISCNKIGSATSHFDLLIMDEASQANVALSLFPLARARRCILVGDQNQLRPVVTIDPKENKRLKNIYDIREAYDYNHSILTTMLSVDSISKFILLKKHYRCAPQIIGFSNQKYYGNQLEIVTPFRDGKISCIDCKGIPSHKKNTSLTEIEVVLDILQNSPLETAIITPFKAQADLLQEKLAAKGFVNVKVGTIHTFQGDEKDRIIISSALTYQTGQGSYDWLKNNEELLNVACTRAKKELILLVDRQEEKRLSGGNRDDFTELIQYIEKQGSTIVKYKENALFESKVKNYKFFNTKTEEEFLETLLHFKSTLNQLITIREKVKVTDVLEMTKEEENFLYANQAHFDFVFYNGKNIPFLAIEVNGYEHYRDREVQERDRKKKEIAKKHDLTLLMIKNDYVRRYNHISKLILNIFK